MISCLKNWFNIFFINVQEKGECKIKLHYELDIPLRGGGAAKKCKLNFVLKKQGVLKWKTV